MNYSKSQDNQQLCQLYINSELHPEKELQVYSESCITGSKCFKLDTLDSLGLHLFLYNFFLKLGIVPSSISIRAPTRSTCFPVRLLIIRAPTRSDSSTRINSRSNSTHLATSAMRFSTHDPTRLTKSASASFTVCGVTVVARRKNWNCSKKCRNAFSCSSVGLWMSAACIGL